MAELMLYAVELGAIQLLHRLLRELRRRHLDEREATRTAGLAIHDDGYARDLSAVAREQLPQRLLVRVVVQIAHVELRAH